MSRKHHHGHSSAPTASNSNSSNGKAAPATLIVDPLLTKAVALAESGQYEKALGVLAAGGSAPHIQNARGVCLMRLGRYEEAVRVYRGLVLHAGGTWARSDVPMHYKTNFATALLLQGFPSGCLSLISEIQAETHPAVVRLRQTLKRWQASLPLWHRLNWWIGRIDPPNCRVQVEEPVGDFWDYEAEPNEPTLSAPTVAFPAPLEQR